mmetsp:Transcript_7467/g.13735  ORF Transcript_7467/g.13735 Transcript_7467/m.13735 type:complete len:138 (-) Transcript_7467:299-712(-)
MRVLLSTLVPHVCRRRQHQRYFSSSSGPPTSTQEFLRAGLPFVLFSVMSMWVLKNAIEGRTKESEVAKGKASKSERQARMEEEKNDMMEKLNKLTSKEFDNTKRIERPEEILERRRKERQQRNVWYRRWGRWITGQQ